MNQLQFQYPQAFWLLLAVPVLAVLFVAYLWWRKAALKRLGTTELLHKLYSTSGAKRWVQALLLLTAVALGVLALANPRVQTTSGPDVRKGIDVVLALDVSNSMLATDAMPNRLTAAKNLINNLLQKEAANRVALILFAGNAYLQVPLTYDYSSIDLFVRAAEPGSIPSQGTALSNALDKAELAFAPSAERYKALVIITDGESHDANAAEKAAALAQKGVAIYTVGLGSAEGSTIQTADGEKKDAAGNVVVSKLNVDLLKQVAESGKGQYFLFDNAATVSTALRTELAAAGTKALADETLFEYDSRYFLFAVPMLLLLAAELFVGDKKRRAEA